ncbi:MAG: ATP-dependent DNA helicase RecG, partial [Candidatus Saccharibacteria bacterium]|nr:ATP-dependent DNA helicase RecG [Candidatus Saccharibacteria bacterium]
MSEIQYLKGVGENSAKLLAKIGLHTPLDLVNNIPRRYDDYSRVLPIQKIKPGNVTIRAKIHAANKRYSKKGLHITEALASDDSGSVRIMWFNQPYRAQSIKANEEYFISGEFAQNYKFIVISNPSIELVSNFPLNTARLVPQYKLTKGLSGNLLRKFTREAFKHVNVNETLPEWLISEKQLIDRRTALFSMHFPETLDSVVKAKKRIGFEEVFEMSLASELNRADFARENALHVVFNESEIVNFVSSLPFKLTNDQKKASWQILQDMTKGAPMNRLLEGDVGSGKTVVATIAALNVATAGFQVAFMAPTEILASQHAKNISKLLPTKYADKMCYLSGGMTKKQKENAYKNIQSGQALIIVGTHALFQEKLQFNNLGLIIIDEQHRFGVQQRKTLQSKANVMPHVLNMTATPIPRSIALTLYGEMDVSILSEKPANRQSIDTKIYQPESRPQLYESISDQLELGRQVFVVCPQIVEDDKPGRSLSVEHIARQIKGWIKDYNVAVIHGKLKSDEKEQIMQDFLNKKSDILVSTT